MELIYVAQSDAFPGVVKIGRTDVGVEQRMGQLSQTDYGPTGFSGDSEWEAISVFVVENNVAAERLLHQHFANLRLEEERELFYASDAAAMSEEARVLVDGTYLGEIGTGVDALDLILDSIGSAFTATGIVYSIDALLPNKFTDNLIERKERLLNLASRRFNESEDLLSKLKWGALGGIAGLSKLTGQIFSIDPFGEARDERERKLSGHGSSGTQTQGDKKERFVVGSLLPRDVKRQLLVSGKKRGLLALREVGDNDDEFWTQMKQEGFEFEPQGTCIVGHSLSREIKRQVIANNKELGNLTVRQINDYDDDFWRQMAREGLQFRDQKLHASMKGVPAYRRRGDVKKP